MQGACRLYKVKGGLGGGIWGPVPRALNTTGPGPSLLYLGSPGPQTWKRVETQAGEHRNWTQSPEDVPSQLLSQGQLGMQGQGPPALY